jgi:hypothetical protein
MRQQREPAKNEEGNKTMSNTIRNLAAAAVLVLGWSAPAAHAADAEAPPIQDDWQFTIAPYVWVAGIEGEMGLFGFTPQDVDISFTDVLENLSMTFSGVTEMRKGPFSVSTELLYVRLGMDVDTPKGILADNIDATAATFMATGLVGYSVYMTDAATFDLVAGARLWSAENEFDFNGGVLDSRTASDGATWIDPVVGAKFKADVSEDIYVAGWGLVGGFGVSSDIMWDVMLFAGYRVLHDEYDNNGFVSDITQSGPIISGTFSF